MKKGFQMALVALFLSAYVLTGCAKETVSTEKDSSNLLESRVNNENDISLLNGFTEIKVDGVDTALLAIEDASKQIGVQDVAAELSFAKEEKSFENTFYAFEQTYEDIPVYGRKEVLTVDKKGNVLSLAGNYLRMNKIDVNPNIKEKDLPSVLAERYGDDVYIESYRLIIYSLFETSPQLSWDCIVRTEDVNEECIVSAIDGDILLVNSLNYFNEMKGIGEDVDNNYVEFSVDLENGHYVMQDNERYIFMYDAGNDTLRYEFCFQDSNGNIYKAKNNNFIDEKGKVVIIEDNGDVKDTNGRVVGEGAELVIDARTSNIFTKLEPVTNSSSTWTNKEAVTIYSRLEKIYDMWLSEFQCKGFNNNNGTIHAVCNDNQKVYGIFDDSGNAYSNSINGHDLLLLSFGSKNSLSSDTIGHEYMHGVITARSNLIYQGESGAIHEGLADVFGEISEDWIKNGILDGDCDWIHSNSRNIIYPDQSPGNKEYPDTYKGFHWVDTSNTSASNDHGGVHNNSTVISHVAYLMSTGINGHICFEPLSTYQIGKLFYTVLYCIPSDCTFNELRAFSESVAEIMYKQGDLTEKQRDCVSNAFFQVNIYKTSKPVAKKVKLTVIPITGDEQSYDNYTLHVIDPQNKQYTYNGMDIKDNDLIFPDYGDYEIRIVDNQNNNNITSLNVKVYEKGGTDELKVYTNCGVYSSFNNGDLDKYANNMEIPVDIYTYFHHYSDTKKVDINDPYTFWMMLSFYATMQMDDDLITSGSKLAERYKDKDQGEMLILSEEEVRDVVNAMMPGITQYPDFPDVKYEKPYKKDGDYYLPLIDLDTEATRMTDIKINDDGTATATVEAFTYYTGEIYETYQVNLVKNDKMNLNSPEPYPYCIESISVFNSQDKTTQEVIDQTESSSDEEEVTPKVVSCWENTAIITKQGNLLMSGHNDYDKLGYDGNDSWQFLKVKDNVRDVFIGASDREELAIITKDNELLMWNYFYGDKGFIPVLDNVDSFVSSYYFSAGYTNAAVTKDGKLYMWGEFYSPDGIGKVESEEPKHIMNNVKQISINEESIGVVTTDGNLLVWGSNEHGQLGTGSTQDVTTSTNILSDISLVSIGEEHSAAIDKEGNLYTWGANRSGELADGSTNSNFYPTIVMTDVKEVVADEGTTYVVDNYGKLYSCGSNFQGALGLGATYEDVREVNKFTEIMSDVVDISAMNQTILVLTASGDVFGFGNNQYGQLGMGNTIEYMYPMHILNIDSYEAATSEERSADIDEAVITDDTKIDLSFSQDDQLINVTLTIPGLDYYRTGEDFDIDVEFTDKYEVYKLDYDADDYGTMARLLVSNMPNGSSMTYTEKTSAQRTINGDSITWSFDATQAGINLDNIKYSGYGIWHIVGLSSRYDSYSDARFATYENKGEELVQINDNNIIEYLYYSLE